MCAFLYPWIKDRLLRKREYADRIRRAAAETVVALELWRQITLRCYESIQPLIKRPTLFVKVLDVNRKGWRLAFLEVEKEVQLSG
jgi:hypothetical protein